MDFRVTSVQDTLFMRYRIPAFSCKNTAPLVFHFSCTFEVLVKMFSIIHHDFMNQKLYDTDSTEAHVVLLIHSFLCVFSSYFFNNSAAIQVVHFLLDFLLS